MKTLTMLVTVCFLTFAVTLVVPNAGEVADVDIDLIEAKINQTPVFQLTLDQVTDLLGRPSKVENPSISKNSKGAEVKFGTALYYSSRGFSIAFEHPSNDSQQHVVRVNVFLTRDGQYQPFQGKLTKSVDANWKSARVLAEFAEWHPEDKYDVAELRRQDAQLESDIAKARKMGMQSLTGTMKSISQMKREDYTQIHIRRPSHQIVFHYEENTKFLERVRMVKVK